MHNRLSLVTSLMMHAKSKRYQIRQIIKVICTWRKPLKRYTFKHDVLQIHPANLQSKFCVLLHDLRPVKQKTNLL